MLLLCVTKICNRNANTKISVTLFALAMVTRVINIGSSMKQYKTQTKLLSMTLIKTKVTTVVLSTHPQRIWREIGTVRP